VRMCGRLQHGGDELNVPEPGLPKRTVSCRVSGLGRRLWCEGSGSQGSRVLGFRVPWTCASMWPVHHPSVE